jgi:hypothetical protein
MRLSPCPACARHVKVGDCTCPFCGAKVACAAPPLRPGAAGMSRAALFAASALGTTLVATDCTSMPLYGGPVPGDDADISDASPVDGSRAPSDAAAPSDAGDESPGAVALYGSFAPVDASNDRGESG